MQSSATVACRAGVMLTCLIAIPLAALFGTRLPDLVGRFLDRQSDKTGAPERDLLAEAPAFEGMAPTGPWSAGSTSAIQEGRAHGLPPDLASRGRLPETVASAGNAAARPSGDHLGSFLPAGHPPRELEPFAPTVENSQAIRASYESPVEPAPTSDAVGRPADSPPQPSGATDRFAGIQQRLRELGATYYVLETWGDRGEYYRFHARMALGTGEDHVRHFDATDADPLAAMARVLGEVERWRAGE